METEYKTVNFEIKQKEEDENFFFFSGYASTFGNVDRGNDIIEKGAFVETLSNMMPKLLWQHDMSEPLGVFTEAKEDEIGLFVRGKLPKEDTLVKGRVIPQMNVGSIESMSIGFTTRDAERREIGDDIVRIIKKVDLWETSLVTLPMNPKAKVVNLKSLDIQRDEVKSFIDKVAKFKDIEKLLGEFGFDKGEAKALISRVKCIARDEQASRDEKAALNNLVDELKQFRTVLNK